MQWAKSARNCLILQKRIRDTLGVQCQYLNKTKGAACSTESTRYPGRSQEGPRRPLHTGQAPSHSLRSYEALSVQLRTLLQFPDYQMAGQTIATASASLGRKIRNKLAMTRFGPPRGLWGTETRRADVLARQQSAHSASHCPRPRPRKTPKQHVQRAMALRMLLVAKIAAKAGKSEPKLLAVDGPSLSQMPAVVPSRFC